MLEVFLIDFCCMSCYKPGTFFVYLYKAKNLSQLKKYLY